MNKKRQSKEIRKALEGVLVKREKSIMKYTKDKKKFSKNKISEYPWEILEIVVP